MSLSLCFFTNQYGFSEVARKMLGIRLEFGIQDIRLA